MVLFSDPAASRAGIATVTLRYTKGKGQVTFTFVYEALPTWLALLTVSPVGAESKGGLPIPITLLPTNMMLVANASLLKVTFAGQMLTGGQIMSVISNRVEKAKRSASHFRRKSAKWDAGLRPQLRCWPARAPSRPLSRRARASICAGTGPLSLHLRRRPVCGEGC
jgi:hypothetical protein